eukprot:CAMPEP_0172735326 /NCGR_PEP_ID=MMETSP1074-20121228/112277_1 /TAXON_ID=2916 /ORGANISM="Ceratium fusus, Strain PA161109" /LENGTH=43 /DNA_ID= /DNA_START= /DNA_END= /DNA_ORIENTATION=
MEDDPAVLQGYKDMLESTKRQVAGHLARLCARSSRSVGGKRLR